MGENTDKSGTKVTMERHQESCEAEISLPLAKHLEVDCIILVIQFKVIQRLT